MRYFWLFVTASIINLSHFANMVCMAENMLPWITALVAMMGVVLLFIGAYIATALEGVFYIGIACCVVGVGLIARVMSGRMYSE
jgi:hypothetical protein